MNNYFKNCKTVQDVKSLYRKLAFEHHPDTGGSTEIMQEVNNQYHNKLKSLDGFKFVGFDNKDHYYRYNYNVEQELIEKIDEILDIRMEKVIVELVGVWIWVHGDTRKYKDDLKKVKCKWHGKRQMWYYRKNASFTKYSGVDFDALRMTYGSNVYDKKNEEKEEKKRIKLSA